MERLVAVAIQTELQRFVYRVFSSFRSHRSLFTEARRCFSSPSSKPSRHVEILQQLKMPGQSVSFDREAQDTDTKLTTSWSDGFLRFPLAVRAPSRKEECQQFLKASLDDFIQDMWADFFFALGHYLKMWSGLNKPS